MPLLYKLGQSADFEYQSMSRIRGRSSEQQEPDMWKVLGGVVAGIFVGAMAYELGRRYGLVGKLRGKAQDAADAFKTGYRRREVEAVESSE